MEKWCGKHVPDLTGCCAVHYTGLRELHDHELKATFFIGAVFYCPEIGCDFFDLDVDDDVVVKDVFGLNKFGLKFIFIFWILIYHKSRQLMRQ